MSDEKSKKSITLDALSTDEANSLRAELFGLQRVITRLNQLIDALEDRCQNKAYLYGEPPLTQCTKPRNHSGGCTFRDSSGRLLYWGRDELIVFANTGKARLADEATNTKSEEL